VTSSAILIPARYNSTRLPGKPLAMLDGVPMIKRVYDACTASKIPTYVLTDDMRIFNLFGPNKCWIEQEHIASYANGTERVAGAVAKWTELDQYDNFVNVQGDMPDVTLDIIEKVIWHLQHYPITTVWTDMPEEKQNDPNTVKMIRAGDQALWFGRGMTGYGDWHLGVYGYKRNPLEFYSTYEVEKEEKIEQLEQLRWLKNGWQIGCLSVQYNGVEINSPEDVTEWQNKNYL
jgi:3-deoxy-manno-octulosonate cytidylyltransferase (CMP-KDO synthetase)